MEEQRRLTLEEIERAPPAPDPGAARAPARRLAARALVRARRGGARRATASHYLDDGRVEGEDPLAHFSPTAPAAPAAHRRLRARRRHHGRQLLRPELDEGCAFEELISFHGGLGGPQTRPFILSPVELPLPDEAHHRRRRRARAAAQVAAARSRANTPMAFRPAPEDYPVTGPVCSERVSRVPCVVGARSSVADGSDGIETGVQLVRTAGTSFERSLIAPALPGARERLDVARHLRRARLQRVDLRFELIAGRAGERGRLRLHVVGASAPPPTRCLWG